LAETCRFYLEHPEERLRVVRQAYEALSSFYDGDSFMDEISQILSRLRVRTVASDAASDQSFRSRLPSRELVARESQELI